MSWRSQLGKLEKLAEGENADKKVEEKNETEDEKKEKTEATIRYYSASFSTGEMNEITIDNLVSIYEHKMQDQLEFPELYSDIKKESEYFHSSLDFKNIKTMRDDFLAQEDFDGADVY